FDQEGQGVVSGDQMRVDRQPQHAQALFEVVFPDWRVPFHQQFPAPDIVDEYVEAALLAADTGDEGRDLIRFQMIDLHGYALTAQRIHQLGSFLDRFWPAIFRLLRARGSSGHVDGCAGGPEFGSYAAPRTAGGAG